VPGWLDSAWLRARLPWLGSWRAGPGAKAVPVTLAGGRTLSLAPMICYDTLAPDLARAAVRQGAELIVTLSNDSWFAVGAGPRLHLVLAAFRSIETRRPQVRSTNTGISAVIDASGEVLGSLGVHERGILVAAVPASRDAASLAQMLGAWLGPVAGLAGAGAQLAALARGRSLPGDPGRRVS
jgi:apolipoprotein N-acyltransferase